MCIFCIINQLRELEIVPSLRSSTLEQSWSKQKQKSIIKQGKQPQQPKLKATLDGSEGSGEVLTYIGVCHNKSTFTTTSQKLQVWDNNP
jgi:hypothetical protein